MKRYWDLSEQERVALTEDDVRAFLAVELMEKGVVPPPEPKYRTVPEVTPKTTEYYGISHGERYSYEREPDLVFERPEQAAAFLKLNPRRVTSKYEFGDVKIAAALENPSVKTVKTVSEEEAARIGSLLKQKTEAERANEQMRREASEASKKVNDATSELWNDYYQQLRNEAEMNRIHDTYNEYRNMCGDNEELALKFLKKAYEADEIRSMAEWFGVVIPDLEVVEGSATA